MSEMTQDVPASLAGPAAAADPPPAPVLPVATAAAVAAGEPLMLSQIAARIKRPRITVPLYLDADAASQIVDAEEALKKAVEYDKTTNEPDTAPVFAQHVRDLEEAAEASKAVFVLQALTHTAYQVLQTQFPPTAEQLAAAVKRAGDGPVQEPAFNTDAFAPALVRAQLITPKVDSDEVFAAFWDGLNDGQMNELWISAVTIQKGVTDPGPKSELASSILQSSGTS